MSFSWVRPKQAPDDEIEVFGLGEPEADDDTGEVLGDRYELLEVIACGGTATVYRALDLTTKSLVAVKVLYKGALAAVGEFFNQEARLSARIRSPHLVHATHFGEDDGRPFIVFDLIEGNALAELYPGTLMPWRELCVVVLGLLAGLSVLHQHGITHRDVKPDNVFVLRTLGEHIHVTLLDMGFAAVPPERRITGAPEPSRKVFGTFGFIAPEMLAGALPEPRCDLYSVGALMYTMLTSQPVPDLAAAPELLCIPSPRMFVPTLPEAVDAAVMRALSDVDARFQNVSEMAAAIRAALSAPDDVVQLEVLAPSATAQAEQTPRTTPTPAALASLEDVEMRPFRDFTAATPSSREVSPPPEAPAPATITSAVTFAPRLARAPGRARLAAAAVGSGLLGAAAMWGLMVAREPLQPLAAMEPVRPIAGSRPLAYFAPLPTSPISSSTSSPTSSTPSPTSSTPSPASSTPSPTSSTPSPTSPAATPTSPADPSTLRTLPPTSPTAPPTSSTAGTTVPAVVIASIDPPRDPSRSADETRRARTFAEIMTRLEPKIRECARKTGFADGPATVQVRSDPRSRAIVSLRVLKMSSEHPFATCAEKVVRQATLPADSRPIEDFTFLKTRGQAAK